MKKQLIVLLFLITSYTSFSLPVTIPSIGEKDITVNSGTICDDGGVLNYNNNSHGILVIYPKTKGTYISLNFSSFITELNADSLIIYDGNSVQANKLGSWSGNAKLPTIFATNNLGAITLEFYSNNKSTYSGFDATIKSVPVYPKSDLIVNYGKIQNYINVIGQKTDINFTIDNIGGGEVHNPNISIGYYISKNNYLNKDACFIDSLILLNNYLIKNYSQQIVFPETIIPGDYYLFIFVDNHSIENEENEENNISKPIPISIIAENTDLSITKNYISKDIVNTSKDSLSTYILINNCGNTLIDSSSVAIYLSKDLNLDSNDVFLTSKTISINYSSRIDLKLPPNLTEGIYYLISYADYKNKIAESIENNNTNVQIIQAKKNRIDLKNIYTSGTNCKVASGNKINVILCAGFQGIDSFNTKVGFYFSNDSILDTTDILISNSTISNLNYYQKTYNGLEDIYIYANLLVPIPQSTSLGIHYIISKLNYLHEISEESENNNYSILPIQIVKPTYDLVAINKDNPFGAWGSSYPGNFHSLYYGVKDNGTAVSPNFTFGCFLSKDSIFDKTDALLWSKQIHSLNAIGDITWASYSPAFNLPLIMDYGTNYLLYVFDYLNEIKESNEHNNCIAYKFNCYDQYGYSKDIKVVNPKSPKVVNPGNTCLISFQIINLLAKQIPSYSFFFNIYLSKDNTIDSNDILLNNSKSYYYPEIAPDTNLINQTISIPKTIVPGNYNIIIGVFDSENSLAKKYNNLITSCSVSIVNKNSILSIPKTGIEIQSIDTALIYNNGYATKIINPNGQLTLLPKTVGSYIHLSFNNFSTYKYSDTLYIYDGTSTSAPLLYMCEGTNFPMNIYATNASGALTLKFISFDPFVGYRFEINASQSKTIPLPDLKIEASTSENISTIKGGDILSKTIIINDGEKNASNFSLNCYLSADSLIDSSDFLLLNKLIENISDQNSLTTIDTLHLPKTLSTGHYYLLKQVNNSKLLKEKDDSNNGNCSILEIVPKKSDLSVSSFESIVDSVQTMTPFTVYSWIKNKGNIPISTIGIKYILSTDSLIDGNDILLDSMHINNLNASNKEYFSKNITLPDTCKAGDYILFIAIDSKDSIIETNKQDNIAKISFKIYQRKVDLTLVSYYPNDTITNGDYYNMQTIVSSVGNTEPLNAILSYYISTDSVFDSQDIFLDSLFVKNIQCFENRLVSKKIHFPSVSQSGFYYLLSITDQKNVIAETNENNNISIKKIVLIIDSIDVSLVAFAPSFKTISQKQLNITYTKINNSSINLSNFYVSCYISIDSVFNNNAKKLTSSNNDSIISNFACKFQNQDIYLPYNFPPGDYFFYLVADPTNIYKETNELNNIIKEPITILPSIQDLVIYNPYFSNKISCSTANINTGFTIYNNSINYYNTIDVGNYLSKDKILDSNDLFLGQITISSFYAQETRFASNSFSLPSNLTSGDYYILSYVDFTHKIKETNESNNCSFEPITIESTLSDLTVDFISVSPNLSINSNFSMNCDISNNGFKTSNVTTLGFFLSYDRYFDSTDVFLSKSVLNGITALNSGSYEFNSIIPNNTIPGKYYIICIVDYDKTETELNENNNYTYTYTSITNNNTQYDLDITNIDVLTFTKNQLNLHCTLIDNWQKYSYITSLGIYLSKDSCLDETDSLLLSMPVHMTPQIDYQIYVNDYFDNLPSGNYKIILYADNYNIISEDNEINNIYIQNVGEVDKSPIIDVNNNVIISPNPVKNYLNITFKNDPQFDNITIKIYNVLGQEVFHETNKNILLNNFQKTINIENISDGIYLLELDFGSKKEITKFSKQ